MASFAISDEDLAPLRDQNIIVTGSESGMGLATVDILLAIGANVVGGDLQPSDKPKAAGGGTYTFVKTDVRSWDSLKSLFKACFEKHGRVDHVFANAGIRSMTTFIDEEFDESGELKPCDHSVLDINYKGVLDTVKLGMHYTRKNEQGGSIVMTASASSFQRFPAPDYTAAKHGVLGLMRGLYAHTGASSPVKTRINAIAPSWTVTGLVREEDGKKAGIRWQPAEAAAKSALICMADASRHGHLIYSVQGKYTEFEEEMLDKIDEILDKADSVDPRIRTETDELYLLLQTRAGR